MKPTPKLQVNTPPAIVTFVQLSGTYNNNIVPENGGRSFTKFKCYRCQETGNYAWNLPLAVSKTHPWLQSLQVGLTMTQTMKDEPTTNSINPNWILFDTCSTISSIGNKNIVQNIQPCDAGDELRSYTNRVHQDYDHTTTLKMLPFTVFLMRNPSRTYSHLPKWSPSSVSPSK